MGGLCTTGTMVCYLGSLDRSTRKHAENACFFSTRFSLTLDPGGVVVDWERVVEAAIRSNAQSRTVPGNAGLLVSAADVQGTGLNGRSMLLDQQGKDG